MKGNPTSGGGGEASAALQVPEVAAVPSTAAASNTDRTKAEMAAEAKARVRRKNKVGALNFFFQRRPLF